MMHPWGYEEPKKQSVIGSRKQMLIEMINKLITDYSAKTGSVFKSVRVEDGQILVKGQIPSSLDRKPKT